ncbi:MAG: diacylglycerol kinase family lipid kinase [Caldilineaceae bacterium]|nr:diacylglycerol kinase family lipid kinase [Caldilineaceae bacterium]
MIHVIINPAAGQNTAVLATLNSVFQPAGIPWRVSITQQAGDARRQAQEAAQEGVDVVAAYGGDGTVVEAASGLLGTDVPLAILPGGTANVVAQDLGIPLDLAAACQLAAEVNRTTRKIDLGAVNDEYFLLRVGMGTEAKITEGADREMKNRLGFLAYVWSAAQSLSTVEAATYSITIDGRELTVEGITCAVINSGNIGVGNLKIAPEIQIDDGVLDVVVIQNANLSALAEIIKNVTGLADSAAGILEQWQLDKSLHHWKGKEIAVRAEPVQVIQYDGELLEAQEVKCRVLPSAVNVLTPRAES